MTETEDEYLQICEGDKFSFEYPFIRDIGYKSNKDGGARFLSWSPGVRIEYGDPTDDIEADSVGLMELRVVGVYKPGKYPIRVFFVRQFIDPDGRKFGKTKLRMTTEKAFIRLCRGYRFPFRVLSEEEVRSEESRINKEIQDENNA